MERRYNPAVHRRRSIRLKGYEYSRTGAYFVTICTRDRECLLGNISAGQMVLNDAGRIVERVWEDLPSRFLSIELDTLGVMPNHVHGIIAITNGDIIRPGPGRGLINQTPTNSDVKWILMCNPKQTLWRV